MKKQLLINAIECSVLLGVSPNQVLRYVRQAGLPCVYLSRRTIRFELNAVKMWSLTRPKLEKTALMKADTRRRKAQAKVLKQERAEKQRNKIIADFLGQVGQQTREQPPIIQPQTERITA